MQSLIEQWTRILHIDEIAQSRSEEKISEVVAAPLDCSRLCWHCCHPWQGEAIPYPFAYDDRTKKFKVGGQFCSFECIKGYSRDTVSVAVSGIHLMNIRHYRKVLTGRTDPFMPAPPKIVLRAFGGNLTIDEFRKPTPNIEYTMNYGSTVKIIPYEAHEYHTGTKNVTLLDTETEVNIKNSNVKNEHLRLRRTKPLAQGRSNIERSLGLNAFANLIKTS
ncbi:MYM-type zinc finger with FCS sequence motif [Acanthocystis turfacea Chlorella virus MO0605SPH]|nr:MYM-type zinc finger with FCS sequence motif [Acanthocystis turfacea Chlorella virus MO0605SPH]